MSRFQVRHQGREWALQFLFGLCFTGNAWEDDLENFWMNVSRVFPDLSVDPDDPARAYADMLIEGVSGHREDLDARILAELDRWTPERVGHIERTAIRIALYEMEYLSDVPPPVAINEAIELTKEYGSDDAPRFVNGILDRLRKSLEAVE